MKIFVINGPNINMLGVREPDIYGRKTYDDLKKYIFDFCTKNKIETSVFQSNHEGEIIDAIQGALGEFDAIVINPAAYTHTSIAIADALKAVNLPTVEVHLTDISNREDFRKISYISPVCLKTIYGKGFEGYANAIAFLIEACG